MPPDGYKPTTRTTLSTEGSNDVIHFTRIFKSASAIAGFAAKQFNIPIRGENTAAQSSYPVVVD